jgi:hypothetical protein
VSNPPMVASLPFIIRIRDVIAFDLNALAQSGDEAAELLTVRRTDAILDYTHRITDQNFRSWSTAQTSDRSPKIRGYTAPQMSPRQLETARWHRRREQSPKSGASGNAVSEKMDLVAGKPPRRSEPPGR